MKRFGLKRGQERSVSQLLVDQPVALGAIRALLEALSRLWYVQVSAKPF